MSDLFLSVVVPAYNEESRIRWTLDQLVGHLSTKPYTWEVVVADDGSTDRTAEIVSDASAHDGRIRVLRLEHRGKGGAVRSGMLDSKAEWRFMCDADLSMPVEQIDLFLPGDAAPAFDIGVGSREVAGARRFGEPLRRHLIGRAYSYVARLLAVGGLSDTQCGFKMYRGELVPQLFGRQRLDGWGFDVEVLFLGRKNGARIEEVPIDWHYRTESKVSVASGATGFLDLLRVRWNGLLGRYDGETEQR